MEDRFTVEQNFEGGMQSALIAVNNVILDLIREGVMTEEVRLRLLNDLETELPRLLDNAREILQ